MEDFNKVYAENHKMVLNHFVMKLRDVSLAEELANDVFMRVHKHLHNYDETISKMNTWIMNIAQRILIDHYRKVKLETLSIEKDSENNFGIVDTIFGSSNPYKDMVSVESMETIQDAISSLKGVYRDVAELFFNDELSYEEISVRLKLPIGTVKGQINRARTKLMAKLEKMIV